MILHRSMKITITAIRLYGHFSTIRHNENGADDKRHSSLASSKACEWALAKTCENAEDDGKVTQKVWIIMLFIFLPLVIN